MPECCPTSHLCFVLHFLVFYLCIATVPLPTSSKVGMATDLWAAQKNWVLLLVCFVGLHIVDSSHPPLVWHQQTFWWAAWQRSRYDPITILRICKSRTGTLAILANPVCWHRFWSVLFVYILSYMKSVIIGRVKVLKFTSNCAQQKIHYRRKNKHNVLTRVWSEGWFGFRRGFQWGWAACIPSLAAPVAGLAPGPCGSGGYVTPW